MDVSNVISIKEYKSQDTVTTLRNLLEKAEAGEISGLIYTVRLGDKNHGVGVTGAYRDDPISGLGATGRVFDILNQAARKMMGTMDF